MAVYKRNTYLINPKFQIKFSIYVCILVFISSLIYPLTIYDLMTSFISYLAKSSPEMASQINDKRTSLISILVFWQIGFTSLIFILCIFFSHKIAGPLYKLQNFLKAIRDGNSNGKLYFRNGDYFKEIADEFNETFEVITEQRKEDFVYLSEVNSYIKNLEMVVPEDKKAVLEQITTRLDEIQSKFQDY